MPPKTIFFTGAPLPSEVRADVADLVRYVQDGGAEKLFTSFSSSIRQFCGMREAVASQEEVAQGMPPLTAASGAAWHSLPLAGEHLRTAYSQGLAYHGAYQGNAAYYAAEDPTFLSTQGETSFRSSEERSSQAALEDVTSQFYEHSLALHDELPTSQIAPVGTEDESLDEESGLSTSFSTGSAGPTQEESLLSEAEKRPVPMAGQITNLDRLPSEGYLKSISPQTMSITIICGIISISPPRSITTRHGSMVEIVEMLVGDDHKSGFGINFWLPPPRQKSALREALQDLRPQDIILVRNMALSSFKGKVYGQSLRREMTKIDLLYRNRIDRTDRAGFYSIKDLGGSGRATEESQIHPQVLKTRRVREWVLRFVGGGPAVVRAADAGREVRRGAKRTREMAELGVGEMPPDTQ